MRRNNVVTFSLVLSVALVIGVTAPRFDLAWGGTRSTVSKFPPLALPGRRISPWPTQPTITAVVPPYIILRRYRTRSRIPRGTVRFGYPSRPWSDHIRNSWPQNWFHQRRYRNHSL